MCSPTVYSWDVFPATATKVMPVPPNKDGNAQTEGNARAIVCARHSTPGAQVEAVLHLIRLPEERKGPPEPEQGSRLPTCRGCKWADHSTFVSRRTPWSARPSQASPWTCCSSWPSRRLLPSSSASSCTSSSADTTSPAPSRRSSYVVFTDILFTGDQMGRFDASTRT